MTYMPVNGVSSSAIATLAEPDRGRQLVEASGLFDAGYYSACYREAFAGGESALDHYFRAGDALGFKPCLDFDPILYRVHHPGARAGNALAHHAAARTRAGWRQKLAGWWERLQPGAGSRRTERHWRVAGYLPGLRMNQPGIPLLGDPDAVQRNRAAARGYSSPCELRIEIDGREYCIRSPAPPFLLERLARNRPFAIPRLPQGFWDTLAMIEELAEDIRAVTAESLTEAERRLLAIRLGRELNPVNGALEEHVIDEVLECIPWHRDSPDYFRAVSFKGFPTCDEQPFYYADTGTVHRDRLRQLARHFSPDDHLLDALLWKRWLISGALRDLPALCRPHPVLLVASDLVGDIGSRWELPHCTRLNIPPENSQRQRHDLLQRIAAELAAAGGSGGGRAPIILFQCGGSLAFWLIARLFRRWPQTFYLDLGQALNAWCYDRTENTIRGWNYLYLRNVIENNGLEAFYRNRMPGDFDVLLERFR